MLTHLLAMWAGEVVCGRLQMVLQGLRSGVFVDAFDTPRRKGSGQLREDTQQTCGPMAGGEMLHVIYSLSYPLLLLASASRPSAVVSCSDKCSSRLPVPTLCPVVYSPQGSQR